MNHKNITPGTLVEGSVSSTDISSDEINQLKAQIQDMQLEIDILKETINVLKKDPDIDQSALSNREKAVIIDVLKNRYSLPLLLPVSYTHLDVYKRQTIRFALSLAVEKYCASALWTQIMTCILKERESMSKFDNFRFSLSCSFLSMEFR